MHNNGGCMSRPYHVCNARNARVNQQVVKAESRQAQCQTALQEQKTCPTELQKDRRYTH